MHELKCCNQKKRDACLECIDLNHEHKSKYHEEFKYYLKCINTYKYKSIYRQISSNEQCDIFDMIFGGDNIDRVYEDLFNFLHDNFNMYHVYSSFFDIDEDSNINTNRGVLYKSPYSMYKKSHISNKEMINKLIDYLNNCDERTNTIITVHYSCSAKWAF